MRVASTDSSFDEAAFQTNPISFVNLEKFSELVSFIGGSQPNSRVLQVVKTAIGFFGLPLAYHCERFYKNMTLTEKIMHTKILKEIELEVLKRQYEPAYSAKHLSFFHVKEIYTPEEQQASIEPESEVCCAKYFRSAALFRQQPSHQLEYLEELPSNPKDLAKLACSFLNSAGGIILVGAEQVSSDRTRWKAKPLEQNKTGSDNSARQFVKNALLLISHPAVVQQRVRVQSVPVVGWRSGKWNLQLPVGQVLRLIIQNDPMPRVFAVEKERYIRNNNLCVRIDAKDFYEYRLDRLIRSQKPNERAGSDTSFHFHAANKSIEPSQNALADIRLKQDLTQSPAVEDREVLKKIRQLLNGVSESQPEPEIRKRQEANSKQRNRQARNLLLEEFRQRNQCRYHEESKNG